MNYDQSFQSDQERAQYFQCSSYLGEKSAGICQCYQGRICFLPFSPIFSYTHTPPPHKHTLPENKSYGENKQNKEVLTSTRVSLLLAYKKQNKPNQLFKCVDGIKELRTLQFRWVEEQKEQIRLNSCKRCQWTELCQSVCLCLCLSLPLSFS